METLYRAFEPYRHVDPVGWVGLFRFLPVWGGGVALVLGLAMVFFGGGRRLFRFVAAPLGALIGTIWLGTVALRLGVSLPVEQVTLGAAVALFVLGLFFPPGVVFFAFGTPIGLVVGQLVGAADWLLGFVPAFVIGGGLGLVLTRAVSAVVSSLVGAWAVTLGLLAVLHPSIGSVETLSQNPIVVFAVAACFAVAGITYQLLVRGTDDKNGKKRGVENLLGVKNRHQHREDSDLQKRWASAEKKK